MTNEQKSLPGQRTVFLTNCVGGKNWISTHRIIKQTTCSHFMEKVTLDYRYKPKPEPNCRKKTEQLLYGINTGNDFLDLHRFAHSQFQIFNKLRDNIKGVQGRNSSTSAFSFLNLDTRRSFNMSYSVCLPLLPFYAYVTREHKDAPDCLSL